MEAGSGAQESAQEELGYLETRADSLDRSMRGFAVSVHVSVAENQFPSTPRRIKNVLDA